MENRNRLERFALAIRRGVVESIAAKGGGHIGGSLDMADALAVLYDGILRVRPEDPDWDGRDYVVCSKGHAGPAIYTALALKNFFPYERLSTLNRGGTMLPGHCDRTKVPGVDATTGSLGQGLSISCGLALGAVKKGTDQRVYCFLGDGELAEGQNWEAAQFAAHYELSNLIALVDWNKRQIDGTNDTVMKLGSIADKFRSFGWRSIVVNGMDVCEIDHAIRGFIEEDSNQPAVVILDTKKGAGVSCVEELENNHCIGVSSSMKEQALNELDAVRKKLEAEGME